MAVIQISKIQVRRGLGEDLPSLASGEMGWSIDERRLFIGNGTLSEGAPDIGNTEILTIYSPIGAALSNVVIIENQVNGLAANIAALQANSTTILSSVTLNDYNNIASNANVFIGSTTGTLEYRIARGTDYRVGMVKIAQTGDNLVYEEDYTETADVGVQLSFVPFGETIAVRYTTTSTSSDAVFSYYNPKTFL